MGHLRTGPARDTHPLAAWGLLRRQHVMLCLTWGRPRPRDCTWGRAEPRWPSEALGECPVQHWGTAGALGGRAGTDRRGQPYAWSWRKLAVTGSVGGGDRPARRRGPLASHPLHLLVPPQMHNQGYNQVPQGATPRALQASHLLPMLSCPCCCPAEGRSSCRSSSWEGRAPRPMMGHCIKCCRLVTQPAEMYSLPVLEPESPDSTWRRVDSL